MSAHQLVNNAFVKYPFRILVSCSQGPHTITRACVRGVHAHDKLDESRLKLVESSINIFLDLLDGSSIVYVIVFVQGGRARAW